MLSPADRLNVVELLSGLSNEDVFSLCNTITKGLIKPNTPEGKIMVTTYQLINNLSNPPNCGRCIFIVVGKF